MKDAPEIIKQLLKMLKFMERNRLFIHPMHSLADRAQAVSDARGCLCSMRRRNCPCTLALREIKTKGHCACKIFFSRKGIKDFYFDEKSKD